MLKRLFRGQSEAADAIGTATETLDAVIEDAQVQRDALQAQYDALQAQISELWTQADAIASQMHELDTAIGEVGAEMDMGGGAVTVQISARDRSRRRAEGDEDIRQQLETLDREKGEVIQQLEAIEAKYGFEYGGVDEFESKVEADLSTYRDLNERNTELQEEMDELIEQTGDEFDVGFLQNY
jgi:chromosome segregation ATPase